MPSILAIYVTDSPEVFSEDVAAIYRTLVEASLARPTEEVGVVEMCSVSWSGAAEDAIAVLAGAMVNRTLVWLVEPPERSILPEVGWEALGGSVRVATVQLLDRTTSNFIVCTPPPSHRRWTAATTDILLSAAATLSTDSIQHQLLETT